MRGIALTLGLIICLNISAQDTAYVRKVMNKLCSDEFAGRGYVRDGHKKAARYIAEQFDSLGLKKMGATYQQKFELNTNIFPDQAEVKIDGKVLYAGVDFLPHPACPSVHGEFELIWLNERMIGHPKRMSKFLASNLSNKFVIVDTEGIKDKEVLEFMKNMIHNPFNAKGVIYIQEKKLTWGGAQTQLNFPILYLNKTQVNKKSKEIELHINGFLEEELISQNVIGYLRGNTKPDSFIVVTGHYDHLGMLGSKTIFPGANDNASGIAMLLNLAAYYAEHQDKLDYSILFIAFSGEEIGLVGSKYYTEHPYTPLNKIKFLVNLDLMGTGELGITAVNATKHMSEYNRLKKINSDKKYVMIVKQRGPASNSDHYHFTEKGVPAFFLYAEGNYSAYHDIFDRPAGLTLSHYNDVFLLVRDFITEF